VGTFIYRLMGAAVLNVGVYEGIEADRSATWQAGLAVVLSSLAAGIGAGGWHGPQPQTFLVFTAIALVTWFAWAVMMFQIGTHVLPTPRTRSTLGELLRTIGFGTAPGLFQAFAAFPVVTVPVFVGSWIWMFAATVVAVRQALDYGTTSRAFAVCALGAVLSIVVAVVLGVLFGPTVS
jgi:hypothetical protein